MVSSKSKNGHQRDMSKRDFTMYLKFVNHDKFLTQRNWGGRVYDSLVKARNFTLILNKIGI